MRYRGPARRKSRLRPTGEPREGEGEAHDSGLLEDNSLVGLAPHEGFGPGAQRRHVPHQPKALVCGPAAPTAEPGEPLPKVAPRRQQRGLLQAVAQALVLEKLGGLPGAHQRATQQQLNMEAHLAKTLGDGPSPPAASRRQRPSSVVAAGRRIPGQSVSDEVELGRSHETKAGHEAARLSSGGRCKSALSARGGW